MFNRKSNTEIDNGISTLLSILFYIAHRIAFVIWSVVEPAVALICACLPTLRPLFEGARSLASKRSYRSHSQSQRRRSDHEEDRQPIRTHSPVQLNRNTTSPDIYVQDEVHKSYSMDDVQPLRVTISPERESSVMLNAAAHV